MSTTVLTVIVVIGMIVILSFIAQKSIKSSWIGVVEDKKYAGQSNDEDSGTTETYLMFFRTDAGKKVKLNVSKAIFDQLNPGDRVEKKSGAFFPVKLS